MTEAVPVSRFGHVELEDMPDDLRARVGAVAEKSGFVPNVFRALARRPAELRAFLDYHDALMDSDEGLSRAERELVVVATSGANHCTYCIVAHGAVLRIRTKDPEIADRVASNPWGVERRARRRSGRRSLRRRDLGRRRHHRAVRDVQPARPSHGAAPEPGVLPDGTAAAGLIRGLVLPGRATARTRGCDREG
jgi:uncharacterized peroxidase-related enzyme